MNQALPGDECPQCGARMVPVLDDSASPASSGPLSADPPVRLRCPSCGDIDTGPIRLG